MESVFVLLHAHAFADGHKDLKVVGVYRTRSDAEAAWDAIARKPGFRDHPDAFSIDERRLNQTDWDDGFFTVYPDGRSSE